MRLPPDYIAGFIDGEGCFTITFAKHPERKLGVDPRLQFEIELRDDDAPILESIQKSLSCGRIYQLSYERYGWNPHTKFIISSIKEIREKLIPFLKKHRLRAKKKYSFQLFCQAAQVFAKREHLTLAGIEKLRKIRKKMNKYSKKRSSVRQGAGKPRARRGENQNKRLF